jgi:hypothetical protein
MTKPIIIAALALAVLTTEASARKRTLYDASTKSAEKLQSQSRGSAIRPNSRAPHPYGRDWDPYAPGVNWPKAN